MRRTQPFAFAAAPLAALVVIAAACLCLIPGCQTAGKRPFTRADAWYHPVPEPGRADAATAASATAAFRGPFRPVHPSLVMLVPEPAEAEAERMLDEKPYSPLTPVDASALAGWVGGPSHGLYLLRGVDLSGVPGEFRVAQNPQGDVKVAFAATAPAAAPGPMRRQAVVTHLERPPRGVFVTVEGPE